MPQAWGEKRFTAFIGGSPVALEAHPRMNLPPPTDPTRGSDAPDCTPFQGHVRPVYIIPLTFGTISLNRDDHDDTILQQNGPHERLGQRVSSFIWDTTLGRMVAPARDQARSTLERQVRPEPVEYDRKTISRAD